MRAHLGQLDEVCRRVGQDGLPVQLALTRQRQHELREHDASDRGADNEGGETLATDRQTG
jgi:hypothetical protein